MIEIIKSENVMNFADVLDFANGIPQATAEFRATLISRTQPVVKFGAGK